MREPYEEDREANAVGPDEDEREAIGEAGNEALWQEAMLENRVRHERDKSALRTAIDTFCAWNRSYRAMVGRWNS